MSARQQVRLDVDPLLLSTHPPWDELRALCRAARARRCRIVIRSRLAPVDLALMLGQRGIPYDTVEAVSP